MSYNTNQKRRTWDDLKTICENSMMDYVEKRDRYKVFTSVGDTTFFTNLYSPNSRRAKGQALSNDADYADFETSHKPAIDVSPPVSETVVNLKGIDSTDGKLAINPTARPIVAGVPMSTVFTGTGDDTTNHKLGHGNPLAIQSTIGVERTHVDVEFDTMFGKVYINEGYCMWGSAGFGDSISISIFAKPSQLQQVVDLDYVLLPTGSVNKLKYVGPGNGTHGLAATPVLVPANEGPSIWGTKAGWWDYSPELGLIPNNDQQGEYDIYDSEVEAGRFVNSIPVYGDSNGYVGVRSQDFAEIPNNYFIRFAAHNVSNTEWVAFAFLTLFRETTVDGNSLP